MLQPTGQQKKSFPTKHSRGKQSETSFVAAAILNKLWKQPAAKIQLS
jgi:hypothetical protein